MGYDERLRRAREDANKTQQGVAAFLGTSQSDYSKQETAKSPSLCTSWGRCVNSSGCPPTTFWAAPGTALAPAFRLGEIDQDHSVIRFCFSPNK